MTVSESTTSVEFRTIDRFDGYKFGSDGLIRSCWKMGPKGGLSDKWRIMASIQSNGYLRINLKTDQGPKGFWAHRLILEAFRGPCPEGMECLHRNNDRTDNRIDNLRWGTHVDNVEDSRRHGTCQMGLPGSRNKQTNLTEKDIPVIRQLSKEGMSQGKIAIRYNVTRATISYILSGKTWKHVA